MNELELFRLDRARYRRTWKVGLGVAVIAFLVVLLGIGVDSEALVIYPMVVVCFGVPIGLYCLVRDLLSHGKARRLEEEYGFPVARVVAIGKDS